MKDTPVSTPTTLGDCESTISREITLDESYIQPDYKTDFYHTNYFESGFLSKLRKANIFMLYEKKDGGLALLAVFTTSLGALSPAISSILIGRVFHVLSDFAQGKYASVSEYMHHIRLTTMSLLALGAGCAIILWVCISSWMKIGEVNAVRARRNMLKSFLDKPVSWYESNDQLMGDLTQLNRCVEEFRAGNAEASALLLLNTVSIFALLGTSFYYSWSVTLVMLASTPLIVVLAFFFARLIETYTSRENSETASAAKVLDWSLTSAKLVRLLQTQNFETTKFIKSIKECKRHFTSLSLVTAINLGSMRFLILCMFVQGFWFGSSQVRKGKATTGDVLTCFTSCLLVGESFRSLLPQVVTAQKANVAINKIQGLLQLRYRKMHKLKPNTKLSSYECKSKLIYPKKCNGDIKFENIEFSYPSRPDTKVLKNVSLHFPVGETTFIVGRSGSGKSTLSSLLLKFYPPTSGRVEIDGVAVSELNSNWLTDNITLVEQTCTLFNDTLRNNILMGRSNNGINETAEDEIQDACQFALLREVINDLDDGLETLVGTHGVSLSGGQQQRVALARAKMRDTPILILDESVSALDIVLRELIIAAVKKWRVGKTTIIMTHELSQINEDDFVYMMEDGKITQSDYRKNLESVSSFKKLVSLQKTTIDNIHNNDFEFNETDKTELQSILSTKSSARLPSQLLSTINPLDIFQTQIDFETENDVMHRVIVKRSKRASIQHKSKLNDIEQGINDKKTRPHLTPITQIVKKMLSTVKKRGVLILALVFSSLNGVVNPIFSFCFSKLLSGIVPQPTTDIGSSKYLIKWSVIVICLALFDGISSFLKEFLLDYSSEIWVFELRKQVFNVISKQGMKWFGEKTNSPSEINTLVLNDSRDLRSLVSHFLSVISTVIILSLLGLIWAFIKGWKLSLVCISLVPLFVITSVLYANLLQTSENEYKNAVADLETQLYETVKGIKTIKVLRLNDYFINRFEEKVQHLNMVSSKRALYTGFGVGLSNMLAYFVEGLLLFYGMKLVGKEEYSVSQLMETFVLLVFSIMSSVQLMSQIPDISRGQRAGTYIFRLLELEPSSSETGGEIIPSCDTEEVVKFQDVTFSYPSNPSQIVLNNVGFHISKCETVAIVGESGSGKSTITMLMTRLFELEPQSSIFFHNVNVNNIDLSYLRSSIAMVDQKADFFDGTIRENITYGLENYTDCDIIECLKLSNIYEFVQSLPDGLNTRIDTSLISGGQAQRLSIARALIRRPKLLILDECTSALDAENTGKIADLIKDNLKSLEITVMMITHSEVMMKISDRILTMKNGTIVEEGSYSYLSSKGGEFHRIITAGMI